MGCLHARRSGRSASIAHGNDQGLDRRDGKIFVGSGSSGADTDKTEAAGSSSDSIEEQWLKRWAFGVSPDGLGLSDERFWDLTHCEIAALREIWIQKHKHHKNEFATLRADLFNSNGAQRQDGQQWTREHFGGDPIPKQDPRKRWNHQELRTRIKQVFGEDGKSFAKQKKLKPGEKPVRVIDTLKGQPMPGPRER